MPLRLSALAGSDALGSSAVVKRGGRKPKPAGSKKARGFPLNRIFQKGGGGCRPISFTRAGEVCFWRWENGEGRRTSRRAEPACPGADRPGNCRIDNSLESLSFLRSCIRLGN